MSSLSIRQKYTGDPEFESYKMPSYENFYSERETRAQALRDLPVLMQDLSAMQKRIEYHKALILPNVCDNGWHQHEVEKLTAKTDKLKWMINSINQFIGITREQCPDEFKKAQSWHLGETLCRASTFLGAGTLITSLICLACGCDGWSCGYAAFAGAGTAILGGIGWHVTRKEAKHADEAFFNAAENNATVRGYLNNGTRSTLNIFQ
jgi:hypothetical protein